MAGLLALPVTAFAQTGSMGQQQQGSTQHQGMMQPSQAETSEIFKNKKESFEIKGTVSSVSSDQKQITVSRKNLPDAELNVLEQTEIKLDGASAKMSQIQPGAEVRARFQLAEAQPIALELKVEKAKGSKATAPAAPGTKTPSSPSGGQQNY